MKILSSADWHINLYKKKVKYDWLKNRFEMLFKKLKELEKQCDVHVIAGDLFDNKPQPDEVCLLLSYLNSVSIPTIIIPGNHEATSKGKTFWSHFTTEHAITNENVHIFCENSRFSVGDVTFCLFPYGSVQTDNLPAHHPNDILVTHIRGEVPPHVTPEYDFEKLRPWKLVLLGDLHFNHKYKDYDVYYPGSPVNTTFDRHADNEYGVDIVEFNSIDNYSVKFVPLGLPKLIRKTVKVGEELVASDYDHVIYEVKGSIDELSKIEKTELLDKKLVKTKASESKLDLKNLDIFQELEAYLEYIEVVDVSGVITEFRKLYNG